MIGLSFFFLLFSKSVHAEEVIETEPINIELNDPTVEISEPMTASELIVDFANTNEITEQEAQKILFPTMNFNLYSTIATYRNYRTIKKYVKPQGFVFFYCHTTEGEYFRAIKKILTAGYNSGSKIYSGTLFCHLADANRIDFVLNGHLYHHGSATTSGGISIGVGQSVTINLGGSYTSGYYKPVYVNASAYF